MTDRAAFVAGLLGAVAGAPNDAADWHSAALAAVVRDVGSNPEISVPHQGRSARPRLMPGFGEGQFHVLRQGNANNAAKILLTGG